MTPRKQTVSALLFALTVPAFAVAGSQHTSLRACDGSAVAYVGDDHFLSATDEDNVLRLYKLGGRLPAREFDMNVFLATEKNKQGSAKEADIEAVARLGDRLYWIGSHGNDKRGKREASRERLFATTLQGSGAQTTIAAVGTPYAGLRQKFLDLGGPIGSTFAAAGSSAPEDGGISIEGLAPAENGLLIGFRSPLVSGKAVVVRLLNPAAVVDSGAEPTFALPELLDLGGRGIRALEPKQHAWEGYWVLAGPTANSGAFNLYEWRPGSAAKPVRRAELSTADGKPEGLMSANAGTLLVSWDGGDVKGCKELPVADRSFVVRPAVIRRR